MESTASFRRLDVIDFLRGIAVLEMFVTHYAPYFPETIAKAISYTETAMALFVLLAGFMVGWSYQRFGGDPRRESIAVWKRGLRVLVIQYVIVLTLGVPLYLIGMPGIDSHQSLPEFILRSMAFLNQIGLLHILPTFIPLFAVSPLVLAALTKDCDVLLLIASVSIFLVGHFQPHILDLGQATIFPFVLFQFYFVIGSLLAKRWKLWGPPSASQARLWLAISLALLTVMMSVVHGKLIPAHLLSTHPLNLAGLAYHAPIIAVVCLASLIFLPKLQGAWSYPYITLFGRHALLAFVAHVYLLKFLEVWDYEWPLPPAVIYLSIVLSVVGINLLLRQYEKRLSDERPPPWVRALHVVFR